MVTAVEKLGRITSEWVAVITAIVFVIVWLVRIESRVTNHDGQFATVSHEQTQMRELEAMRFNELRMDLAYIRMRLDAVSPASK